MVHWLLTKLLFDKWWIDVSLHVSVWENIMSSKHDNDGVTGMSKSAENYINEAKHAAENELNGDEVVEAIDLNVEDGGLDNDEFADDSVDDDDSDGETDEEDNSDYEDDELDDLDFDDEDSDDLDDDDSDEEFKDEDDSEEESDEDDDDTDNASDDDDNFDEEDSGADDLDAGDDEESDDLDNDDSDKEFKDDDDEDTEVNFSEENVPDGDEHEDSHVEEDIDEIETETYDAQEEISGEMTDVTTGDDLHDDSDKTVSIAISEGVDVNRKSGVENNMRDIIDVAGNMAEPVKRQRAIKKKSVPKDIIKGINVDLTFETARQSISLGELSAIKEGYTFVSPNPVTSLIDVRANGKLIGHGRLVNVDGRVGVQITEIL